MSDRSSSIEWSPGREGESTTHRSSPHERLAEALHRLNRPELKLVIAGGKGWLADDLYHTIDDLGMGGPDDSFDA